MTSWAEVQATAIKAQEFNRRQFERSCRDVMFKERRSEMTTEEVANTDPNNPADTPWGQRMIEKKHELDRLRERFAIATNNRCTCGGSGPGETDCVACSIYHEVYPGGERDAVQQKYNELKSAVLSACREYHKWYRTGPSCEADDRYGDTMRALGGLV